LRFCKPKPAEVCSGSEKITNKRSAQKNSKQTNKHMRIISNQRKSGQGFTLIEMIGVLAVIAILASMLIPKIFEAINNSRINNAALSYNTVKTALGDHYSKYGAITATVGGVAVPLGGNYDQVLVTEGFLDKPWAVRIGDNAVGTDIVLTAAEAAGNTPPDGINSAYNLDNAVPLNDAFPAGAVVEAVITGVLIADARELSLRLDGAALSSPDATPLDPDLVGRVKYAVAGATTTVRMYIAHR
jgi:prepilin-type N-terminal cleavage/methylation domain-containing protein